MCWTRLYPSSASVLIFRNKIHTFLFLKSVSSPGCRPHIHTAYFKRRQQKQTDSVWLCRKGYWRASTCKSSSYLWPACCFCSAILDFAERLYIAAVIGDKVESVFLSFCLLSIRWFVHLSVSVFIMVSFSFLFVSTQYCMLYELTSMLCPIWPWTESVAAKWLGQNQQIQWENEWENTKMRWLRPVETTGGVCVGVCVA